ncbi:hypothetical protein DZC72_04325 [Maribacter algicola]|uniref:HNH domain-containing protein n=1 Tax=Maribacter algicola TaxID=2498892 RepID=A0A426RLJ0_9FLAO|nr:hypothetical protein DZC72_04325 [Maribacter algicola]
MILAFTLVFIAIIKDNNLLKGNTQIKRKRLGSDKNNSTISKLIGSTSYNTIAENREDKPIYDVKRWIDETIEFLDQQQSLVDLLIVKNVSEINYGDLLRCFEWKFLRLEILWRDGYKCEMCGIRDLHNHVHHKQYIKDELPWTISHEYLQTLCRKCHVKIHSEQEIPIYSLINGEKVKVSSSYDICTRCGGTGYLPQFSYYLNGICFKCQGASVDKRIFTNVLNMHLNSSNSYKEFLKRARYKDFFRNIKPYEFKSKYCDLVSYEKNPSPIVHQDNEEDELPF